MRTFFLLLVLLGSANIIAAQSALLKDPDVVWAAEIEQDWKVDIASLKTESDSGITTLKLLRKRQKGNWWSSIYLAELVFQAAIAGDFPVYKDPLCIQPFDANDAYPSRDTITTFDAETHEEKTTMFYVEPQPQYDFKAWRLRQVLAYHAKSARWSTTVEAIAPLIVVNNLAGDSIGVRPLFWFRPDDNPQDVGSEQVVWAKQISNDQKNTRIPIGSGKILKTTEGFERPVARQIRAIRKDPALLFYNANNEAILTQAERSAMEPRMDTVVVFNPETYEEHIRVSYNNFNINHITELRLLQIWYWNDKKKRLSICLDAIAPLIDVLDSEGNLRFKRLLYFQRR